MIIIESAGITDIGQNRKGNEDNFFVDDGTMLYMVADGMGGHQAGEVASELTVDNIRDYMIRFNEGMEVEDPLDFLTRDANRLFASIAFANNEVYQVSQSKDSFAGMGTTLSAVYCSDKTMIAANVGDSPIYLVHDGKIELLSEIHTIMAEQIAFGQEGSGLMGDKFKHMLTRAIGVGEDVKPYICEFQIFKGDTLIICSDGLGNKVLPEEINSVIKMERPEKACKILVDMANERGGEDNITVVVLRVKKVFGNNRVMKLLYKLIKVVWPQPLKLSRQ